MDFSILLITTVHKKKKKGGEGKPEDGFSMWKKSVQFSVRTEFCKHMTVHTFAAASRHLYLPRLAVMGEGWWGPADRTSHEC